MNDDVTVDSDEKRGRFGQAMDGVFYSPPLETRARRGEKNEEEEPEATIRFVLFRV
jgi:hypothetical protein